MAGPRRRPAFRYCSRYVFYSRHEDLELPMTATEVQDRDTRSNGRAHGEPSPEPTLELVVGDITREHADAIVNPVGPGLVDLSIRRAAGPDLVEAFHHRADELPGARLRAGEAIATPGFRLPAAHVIHCGPPSYLDDPDRARRELVSCHVEALKLARAEGWASVAFPAIGVGVYCYPAREAADVAVGTVVRELRRHRGPNRVRFVLARLELLEIYAAAAAAVGVAPAVSARGAVFAAVHVPRFAA
jgi:O-acetyl-ADP-ribose deacetylase (regulator of RNase III)